MVYLGLPCVRALVALVVAHGGTVAATERVFPLTDQQIRDRLKTLGRRIGVHLTPHLFRHAFASHLHSNGASERVIMDMLGHRRVDTTQIYLDVSDRTIQEKCDLITRAMANIRGRGDDPRALRHVIASDRAGLILR
jgi:integrase